jgi:Fe-S-cluster containining protein
VRPGVCMADQMRGKCCKNIGLSVSPSEMQASYQQFVENMKNRGVGTEPLFNYVEPIGTGLKGHTPQASKVFQDIHLIYPMLEFLYSDHVHPNGNVETPNTVYHYRCRHSDDKLKKCAIYEIRPRMCVTFPIVDGTHCKYTGCACAGDGRKEHADKMKKSKELKAREEKRIKDLAWKRKNCKMMSPTDEDGQPKAFSR